MVMQPPTQAREAALEEHPRAGERPAWTSILNLVTASATASLLPMTAAEEIARRWCDAKDAALGRMRLQQACTLV